MEAEFFADDIKAVDKALALIEAWNRGGHVDKTVTINTPGVWTWMGGSSRAGQKVLHEPFITNYQKFNSNSGWADDATPWPRVMQALSHFSYHQSGGKVVLCDLQGGVYADGVALTDPAVLSRDKCYGVTDLGPTGISTFFSQHRCNEFCQAHWAKLADRTRYHTVTAGTSMVTSGAAHVPTRRSREPMSFFYGGGAIAE